MLKTLGKPAYLLLALVCLRLAVEPCNELGGAPEILKKALQGVNFGIIVASVAVLWEVEASRRTLLHWSLFLFIPFSIYQITLTILTLDNLTAVGPCIFAILKVTTGPLMAIALHAALGRGALDGHGVIRALTRTLNWLMLANLFAILLFPGMIYIEKGYNILEFEKILGMFPVKENYASFLIFGVVLNLYLILKKRGREFLVFLPLHFYLLGILNSRSQVVGLILFFGVVVLLSLSLRLILQAGVATSMAIYLLRDMWMKLPIVITLTSVLEAFSKINPIDMVLQARPNDIYYILSSSRTMIWRNAIDNFFASPMTARIFGNPLYITNNELLPPYYRTSAVISYYIDPHSDIFFLLHQFGVVGLISMIGVFIWVAAIFFSRRATLEGKYCCAILVMTVSSSAITNGIFSRFIPQVLALAVLIALSTIHRETIGADSENRSLAIT